MKENVSMEKVGIEKDAIGKSTIEKNSYRFVQGLLLTACVLCCVGKYLGVSEISWSHLSVSVVILAFLAAWCQCALKGRVVLGVSAMAAFAVTYMVVGGSETARHLQNYVHGIFGMGGENGSWGRPQECIQVTFIALVCFGVGVLTEQLIVIRAAMAGALFSILIIDLFGTRSLTHMGVVCVLLYVVIVYVEWTEGKWKKERLYKGRHYMVRILPFWMLYFVLMAFMPAPEEPYDWQFIKDAYTEVREVFLQASRNWFRSDKEDFAFGNSGFSGDGKLLGGIEDEEKTLMIIQGQATLKTNVYLTGKVYNVFDGNNWENKDDSEINDRQLDALETVYAVRSYDAEGEGKYLERTGLRIWYEDFRTGYLFAPLKTLKFQNVEEDEYTSAGGNYQFSKKQGYGLMYHTSFLQLNVDHPVFYDFLEQELERDEEVFDEVQKDYLKSAKYSLTDLVNHKKHIQSVYGKPVELSKEVKAWLSKVTEGAQTDIDKLKAIEAALQGMNYTKTPGELPVWVDSDREFLDYFLLESQEGYCVYYATAMVLLARAEGIPARYVEGFCVPVSGTYKVLVTSEMAHGWPEVYIENIGWIPFEPTPGYSEIRYTPWEIQAESIAEGEGFIDGNIIESEELVEEEEEELQETLEPVQEKNSGNLFKIIGFTMLFAVATGALILTADWCVKRNRMRKEGPEERFRTEIGVNMRLLAALGYEREEHETLTELRKRAWAIMDEEPDDAKPEFQFLKYYEEHLYGQYPVKDEMFVVLKAEKDYLLQMLKRWKPVLYIYYHLYYNFF